MSSINISSSDCALKKLSALCLNLALLFLIVGNILTIFLEDPIPIFSLISSFKFTLISLDCRHLSNNSASIFCNLKIYSSCLSFLSTKQWIVLWVELLMFPVLSNSLTLMLSLRLSFSTTALSLFYLFLWRWFYLNAWIFL